MHLHWEVSLRYTYNSEREEERKLQGGEGWGGGRFFPDDVI